MGVNGGVVIKFWKTMETARIKHVWMGLSEFKSNKFSLSSKAVSRKLIISKLAVTIHKNSSMTIHKLVSTHIYLIHCSLFVHTCARAHDATDRLQCRTCLPAPIQMGLHFLSTWQG